MKQIFQPKNLFASAILLGLGFASSAFAKEECKIVLNNDRGCGGRELVGFKMDSSGNRQGLDWCNLLPLPRNAADVSLIIRTMKSSSIDMNYGDGIRGVFWNGGDLFNTNEKGELVSLWVGNRYDPMPGKYAVRCFRKSDNGFLADNTWRRAHRSSPGDWGDPVVCATTPTAAWCNYTQIPKLTGANGTTVADVCPGQTQFDGYTGKCECKTAECCASGTKFSVAENKCLLTNPSGDDDSAANFAQIVTSGYQQFAEQNSYDSGVDEKAMTAADRSAMAAGGSLADQGLMAKTIDSTKSAAGAGDLGGAMSSLFGGMIGSSSGSGSNSESGKSGSNGSSSLGVGDALGDKKVIAAVDGATYQGGKTYTGNTGRDGSGAGGAGLGGRAFGGSGMEGGSAVTANGQTPGMEFGGRKPASAGGADDANAMLGEDPDDYFARINLGDNLFKIVEKRYRTKQTGWVLSKPAAVLKK